MPLTLHSINRTNKEIQNERCNLFGWIRNQSKWSSVFNHQMNSMRKKFRVTNAPTHIALDLLQMAVIGIVTNHHLTCVLDKFEDWIYLLNCCGVSILNFTAANGSCCATPNRMRSVFFSFKHHVCRLCFQWILKFKLQNSLATLTVYVICSNYGIKHNKIVLLPRTEYCCGAEYNWKKTASLGNYCGNNCECISIQ